MKSLYEKLKDYNESNYCPMHMPGHKRNTDLLGNNLPYNIDITEIDGFDDLHNPTGILKQIQDRISTLFGSKKSYMLVNGSTSGILSGIRSITKQGDYVLVARNCHKSVYNAIELNNLNPIYLKPNINRYGIALGIDAEEIDSKLNENPKIKLVILTSPTYEGYISNMQEIVKVVHKHNIPILVDEAHGAHLKFMKEPQEAVNAGADIVIQSLHKTLPALTQTAVLHIQGSFVNEKEVERQLSIFETSSPSYILMSSIDECINILEKNSETLFENYKRNLNKFYKKCLELKKLKILANCLEKDSYYDYGKIVVITSNTGLTGNELADILRKKFKIEIEMSSINYIIAMTSICDKKENFERFSNALHKIDNFLVNTSNNDENFKKDIEVNIINDVPIPEKKMLANDTRLNKDYKYVNIKNAENCISSEYIWTYPPGIPIIVPGEIINTNVINILEQYKKSGIEVRTDMGKFPEIRIIDNK